MCSAIILVFFVNDCQSYNNIAAKWFPVVKLHCPSASVILVGSKTDLREKCNKTVTTEMGKQLAREINAVAYFECSFRDGRTATIERIFETATRASYFVKAEKFLKSPNKTLFKVNLIGDANVGKSSLQNRFQINESLNKFNQRLTLVRRHNFTPLTGGIGTIVPKLILWEICRCKYFLKQLKLMQTVSLSKLCDIIKHRPDTTYYDVIMQTDEILHTTRTRVSLLNFELVLL